ncbi:MAG: hypothetical protein WB565_14355 [Acidimicrobiales bacterium]
MSGLPLVPAASCPSAASALASAGLGPICSAASAASGAVGQAASSVVGFGANTVLDAIGSWVSSGAVWLLGQIGAVLGATTSIDLGASWFTAHYETMAALAGVVVLPLLLLGIVQSVYRQSASMLVRSVLMNVPLAILLTAIAVKLVQIGLSVTDSMSAAVAHGAGLDTGNFMASVVTDLDSGSGSGTPAFVLFLGGIVVVIGAVLVWIELLIRSAAVYVAVLFLPLALASLAWPAIAHWCRRLVDTLAALVLGKFVIVSVLSLAAGALAGGSAAGGGGAAAGGGGGGGGGFAAVLGGAALLLLAAFAPWALFRLIPFMEAGAVGHLEGLGRRAGHQAAVPARGLAQVAMRTAAAHSMATAASAGLGLPGSGGAVSAGTSSAPSSPLAGASSAEVRGVGTMSPPGAGIPLWEPHPAPSAAAGRIPETFRPDDIGRRQGRSLVGVGADDLASSGSSASVQSLQSLRRRDEGDNADGLRPLPKQSGVLWADSLGRDRLGVKLVSKAPASDGGPGVPTETPRLPDPDDG